MNKKKLLELLQKKEARKADLALKAEAATTEAELRGIISELNTLNDDIAELRGIIDSLPDEPTEDEQRAEGIIGQVQNVPGNANQTHTSPIGRTQILASYGIGNGQHAPAQRSAEEDPYGTMEYRRAFMRFAKKGEITPELRNAPQPEFRLDGMTQVSDISAVVPTTILNEVVRKLESYGQVFNRVRKTNIRGGVNVPILSLSPTATWIGESSTSDKQKVEANTNVSFSYYGLECKVSVSLLADTVSLEGFEMTITDLIVEAIIKALDIAIIKGNGAGKALGITQDTRVPVAQIVTLSSDEIVDWSSWKKKVFAKMPLRYKAGATFLMSSGTFESYIDGMVDANGQPIGRINYGITEGPQERFGGKEVILVEDDVISPYDDASAGDVIAIYCNLRNYAINSNLQMTMFRYFDHKTNEWVDKAIMIVDGKLIDPNGVVIVKKGNK